jgi:hypothetical protein
MHAKTAYDGLAIEKPLYADYFAYINFSTEGYIIVLS